MVVGRLRYRTCLEAKDMTMKMEFKTFEQARRAALFQAAGSDTVVVKRGDRFVTMAKSEATEGDTILGYTNVEPARNDEG